MSFKQIHKWVSLIVFAQLLIWLATGFLLGKIDSNSAGGRDTMLRQSAQSMAYFYEQDDEQRNKLIQPLISINSLLKDFPTATQIRLTHLLNRPVYQIQIAAGAHAYEASDYKLVDALSGQLLDLSNTEEASKNEDIIYALAFQSHKEYVAKLPGTSPREAVTEVSEGQTWSKYEHSLAKLKSAESAMYMLPPIDDLAKERNAVWQVNLHDDEQTSIYIRAQTGQVIAHVNDLTRWRDLLLMLHFMDYTHQGNFNNWFMRIFAFLTLLLAATGVWWLGRLLRDGQIKVTWFTSEKSVTVDGPKINEPIMFKASKNTTVLAGLLNNDINIQAVCGGGGTCGTCKFKGSVNLVITRADSTHLSNSELDAGYRLACQHHIKEVSIITLNRHPVEERDLPQSKSNSKHTT